MVEGQWCYNLGAEVTPSEIDHHIKCDQMKKDMINVIKDMFNTFNIYIFNVKYIYINIYKNLIIYCFCH